METKFNFNSAICTSKAQSEEADKKKGDNRRSC